MQWSLEVQIFLIDWKLQPVEKPCKTSIVKLPFLSSRNRHHPMTTASLFGQSIWSYQTSNPHVANRPSKFKILFWKDCIILALFVEFQAMNILFKAIWQEVEHSPRIRSPEIWPLILSRCSIQVKKMEEVNVYSIGWRKQSVQQQMYPLMCGILCRDKTTIFDRFNLLFPNWFFWGTVIRVLESNSKNENQSENPDYWWGQPVACLNWAAWLPWAKKNPQKAFTSRKLGS